MFIRYQYMLFGETDDDGWDVEVEAPETLLKELGIAVDQKCVNVSAELAATILERRNWPNNKTVRRWYIDRQELYSR